MTDEHVKPGVEAPLSEHDDPLTQIPFKRNAGVNVVLPDVSNLLARKEVESESAVENDA